MTTTNTITTTTSIASAVTVPYVGEAPPTARSVEQKLHGMGLPEEAIRMVIRGGAARRARHRADLALLLALKWGWVLLYGDCDGSPPFPPDGAQVPVEVALAAWAACALDAGGVGGTAGVTGEGTERHPAFRGKIPRKQAQAGEAWTAAIAQARGILGDMPGGGPLLAPTADGRVEARAAGPEGGPEWKVRLPIDGWVGAEAGRRLLGAGGHPGLPCPEGEELLAWGAVWALGERVREALPWIEEADKLVDEEAGKPPAEISFEDLQAARGRLHPHVGVLSRLWVAGGDPDDLKAFREWRDGPGWALEAPYALRELPRPEVPGAV